MKTNLIHINVTDDHPLMLQGVCQLLEAESNMVVTGRYSLGKTLLEGLAQQAPDVLLLDINLPDITGNILIRTLHKTWPSVRVIAYTSLDASFQVKDMMQQGCAGYLLKSSPPARVITAINTVHEGNIFIEPSLQEQLLRDAIGLNDNNLLTKREREILSMICDGETNNTIAEKLFLSLRTIESHRSSLYQKFRVNNTAGLVKAALMQGLV